MLRQLRTIRRSVPDSVFQSLVVSLVLNRLDFGNATFAGLPAHQYRRLQSVLNAAARLIYRRRRFDHVTPLLRDLHWLKVPERVAYKLAVTVYRCLHGMAPPYLCDGLQRVAELNRRRYVLQRPTPLSSHQPDSLLSVTVPFPSPAVAYGTVCQLTSRPQQLCLFLPRCMECRRGLTMRFLSVCLSLCLSVCLSNACIVTKRNKDMFRFLYHTKEHLS